MSERIPADVRRTTDASVHALKEYQPAPCEFPCVLIRARIGAPRDHADPSGGWGRFAQGGFLPRSPRSGGRFGILWRRLQEAGYGLAGLFLIDQPGPDVRLTVRDWIYWQWAAVCHLPWRLRWPYLVDGLRYRLRTVAWLPSGLRRCFYSNEWKNTEPGQRLSANEYRRRTTDAGIHALRNYRPLACDFPCFLVRAKSGAPRIHADPYGGWGTVTDLRVKVFDLEGTHMTMFQPESLAALAAIFRECMDGDDSRSIKVSVGV